MNYESCKPTREDPLDKILKLELNKKGSDKKIKSEKPLLFIYLWNPNNYYFKNYNQVANLIL